MLPQPFPCTGLGSWGHPHLCGPIPYFGGLMLIFRMRSLPVPVPLHLLPWQDALKAPSGFFAPQTLGCLLWLARCDCGARQCQAVPQPPSCGHGAEEAPAAPGGDGAVWVTSPWPSVVPETGMLLALGPCSDKLHQAAGCGSARGTAGSWLRGPGFGVLPLLAPLPGTNPASSRTRRSWWRFKICGFLEITRGVRENYP